MTYQEAKERFSKERPYLANHDWKIAYYLAEQSLEKQIPKKPKPHEDDEYSAKCPNCYDEIDTHWVHGGISYCPNCGQAIDWSDAK